MKYINKLTGYVIDTECVISGDDWEMLVESQEDSNKVDDGDQNDLDENNREDEEMSTKSKKGKGRGKK